MAYMKDSSGKRLDSFKALTVPRADLATLGDSITEGQGGGGVSWPALVSDWLGLSLWNPSVPGEMTANIATRQGGLAPTFTIPGNSLPANTNRFTVVLVAPSNGWKSGTTTTAEIIGDFDGRFAGVPVNLRYRDNAWTMARAKAGSAIAVSASGEKFYAHGGTLNRDAIQTLWAGRNGGDPVRETASMAAFIRSAKYVVLSILTQGDEPTGSGGHTLITGWNASLKAAYPNNYLDIRKRLIQYGLADAGITATAQDLIDIANDTVPSSLRFDLIHPNAAGYRVIAKRIAYFLALKGYVPASTIANIPGPAMKDVSYLNLADATSYASMTSSAELKAAQNISVRVVASFPNHTSAWNIASRSVAALNQRAWQLQMVGTTSKMQWQIYHTGAFGTDLYELVDSPAFTFTDGVPIGLRVDNNVTNNTVTFYTSADEGATWTQLGSPVAVDDASIFATSTAPLTAGAASASLVGPIKSLKVQNLDGSVVYVNEDFTDGSATGWTMNGNATLMAAS